MSKLALTNTARPSAVPPAPTLTPPSSWSDAVAEVVDVMINPLEFDSHGHGSERYMPPLYTDDWNEIVELEAEYSAVPWDEVGARDLFDWLLPLSMVVRNPPSKEEVAAFCAALLSLLDPDTPRWVLNIETQCQAARKWQFFPAAADVFSILDPVWHAVRERRATLRALMARKPRNPRSRAPHEEPYQRRAEVRFAGGAPV